VTTDAFRHAGEKIGRLDVPILIVQEGGYEISVIGDCLEQFLSGMGRF
jgi:acetoin utilization deacetylase AcuC-like enzyme